MDPYYTFHMYERNYITHEPMKTHSKFVSEIVRADSLINAKDKEVKQIQGYLLRFSPMLTQKSVDGTKEFVMIKKENLIPLTTFFLICWVAFELISRPDSFSGLYPKKFLTCM